MKPQVLLLELLGLFGLGATLAIEDIGIGISFSSTYATVSACLANQSYIDIAKIEGGERYQAYMLGTSSQANVGSAGTIKYCPFPKQFCERYWPIQGTSPSSPILPLLKALIAAAEAALEVKVDSVVMSAVDVGTIDSESAQQDFLKALGQLRVDGWGCFGSVARYLPWALGINGNCSSAIFDPDNPSFFADPEQAILTVEYARNALAAAVWTEECGYLERLGRMSSIKLGHSVLETCRKAAQKSPTCDEDLELALRNICMKAIRDGFKNIGAVLLMGEQADDPALLIALRKVLADLFDNGQSIDISQTREVSTDPSFVGSWAIALAEWDAKQNRRSSQQHGDL